MIKDTIVSDLQKYNKWWNVELFCIGKFHEQPIYWLAYWIEFFTINPDQSDMEEKKQYQNISDSEICIYICSKNKYMSELELVQKQEKHLQKS